MSVKYFVLLSCLAYYVTSAPVDENGLKEDGINVQNLKVSIESLTTIAEQGCPKANPLLCHKTLLCDYSMNTLSDAVIKEIGVENKEITIGKLESVIDETERILNGEHSELSGLKAYLSDKVFVDGKVSIAYEEFKTAMTNFNRSKIQKIVFDSIDLNGDGKISPTERKSFMAKFRRCACCTKHADEMAEPKDTGEDHTDINFEMFELATENSGKRCNKESHNTPLIDKLQSGIDKDFKKVDEPQVEVLDDKREVKIQE